MFVQKNSAKHTQANVLVPVFKASHGSKMSQFLRSFSLFAFSYPIADYFPASCLICLDAKHCSATKTSHSAQNNFSQRELKNPVVCLDEWIPVLQLILWLSVWLCSNFGDTADVAAMLEFIVKGMNRVKNLDVALSSVVSRKCLVWGFNVVFAPVSALNHKSRLSPDDLS